MNTHTTVLLNDFYFQDTRQYCITSSYILSEKYQYFNDFNLTIGQGRIYESKVLKAILIDNILFVDNSFQYPDFAEEQVFILKEFFGIEVQLEFTTLWELLGLPSAEQMKELYLNKDKKFEFSYLSITNPVEAFDLVYKETGAYSFPDALQRFNRQGVDWMRYQLRSLLYHTREITNDEVDHLINLLIHASQEQSVREQVELQSN